MHVNILIRGTKLNVNKILNLEQILDSKLYGLTYTRKYFKLENKVWRNF